jgi:hypothetical protein
VKSLYAGVETLSDVPPSKRTTLSEFPNVPGYLALKYAFVSIPSPAEGPLINAADPCHARIVRCGIDLSSLDGTDDLQRRGVAEEVCRSVEVLVSIDGGCIACRLSEDGRKVAFRADVGGNQTWSPVEDSDHAANIESLGDDELREVDL